MNTTTTGKIKKTKEKNNKKTRTENEHGVKTTTAETNKTEHKE